MKDVRGIKTVFEDHCPPPNENQGRPGQQDTCGFAGEVKKSPTKLKTYVKESVDGVS